MAIFLAITLAGSAGPDALDVEQHGVHVHVEVRASLYTWEVTNLAAEPIVRFEIAQHNSYDHQVPEGWKVESPMPEGVFQASAVDWRTAIRPGRTGRFSLRASSKRAFLGEVEAAIGFASGGSVTLQNVWGTVPESRGTIYVVAGTLMAIVLLHTLLLACRDRRRVGAASNGA